MQVHQKLGSGDVRGARVRLEAILERVRKVETENCNDCGFLIDPGA
jgi:hypothetical protein